MLIFRSILFYLSLTIWTILMGIICLPFIILPSKILKYPTKIWIRGIFIFLKLVCNIKHQIIGLENIPDEPLLIVSKHQSTFETFGLYYYLKDCFFIHKKELFIIPIFGQYLLKSNMVAIDRSGGTLTMRKMLEDVKKEIKNNINKDIVINSDKNKITFLFSEKFILESRNRTVEQSIEVVRKRVDESGTKEPTIQKQGEERIIVQLPGVKDPERIKTLIGRTAKLNFHMLDPTTVELAEQRGKLPPGTFKVQNSDPTGYEKEFIVKKRVLLTGDRLKNAAATVDPQTGRYVVAFEFDTKGSKKFAKITTENTYQRLAILLDNKVVSAPQIREPITGGQGNISGNFSANTANDLAVLLRAGSLPAPIKVLEERTVGPSLGLDSIEAGKKALMIGFVLVIIFMIVRYKIFGLVADLAIIINVILLVSMLSAIEATLTMPGIAGIVLTVGMAVDANVLVFERIKEELRSGRSIINSIDLGYKYALKTIIDANFTTLIAALLLFNYGSGPIKGFAVTLSIGILTSMFSALILTKMVVSFWVLKFKPNKIYIN